MKSRGPFKRHGVIIDWNCLQSRSCWKSLHASGRGYNEAIYKGTLAEVKKQSAAMIRGWRALDAAAKQAGHETLPDNYIESEPIDGTIYAFTTGDAANAKVLQEGRENQIVTYSAQEAALIIHKWPQLRQSGTR